MAAANSAGSDDEPSRILALGDSYTVGTGVDDEGRWVTKLTERLRSAGDPVADPVVVAENGWTTGDLEAGIDDADPEGPFDLVTLLVGANNCFQGESAAAFEPKFRDLLDRALGFATDPSSTVVITVPDYTLTPVGGDNDPEEHAERLETYNEIVREAARARETRLVDVVPPSKRVRENPELIADDDLHPAPAQHELWLERIEPVASDALSA